MLEKRLLAPIFVALLLSLFFTAVYFSITDLNDEIDASKFFTYSKKPIVSKMSLNLSYKLASRGRGNTCSQANLTEQRAIVFIKIMKCASTSISSMMLRFAHERDLELVFPVNDKLYIGWPYFPKQNYIVTPTRGKLFHIACDHVVYDKSFFDSIMMLDVKYITILRHPYSQFKSMVNYFNVLNISGVPQFKNETERFLDFVYNLEYYDMVYKFPNSSLLRHCIPNFFSMTKNLMSYSLGFPYLGGFNISKDDQPSLHAHHRSHARNNIVKSYELQEESERHLFESEVKNWLKNIGNEMSLALIVEWLPESLVMLRRMFCWSIKDILILNYNSIFYHYKFMDKLKDIEMESIYKSWSWVDYELYNYFNRSLWRKLNSQTVSFWGEVERFKEILLQITDFCSEEQPDSKVIIVEESKWNDKFEVHSTLCISFGQYRHIMKSRYSKKLMNQFINNEVQLNESFC